MPFQSIEPRRLYRQIADQVRMLIRNGEFAAGARLPPERDLARELGVSRPSVREALIALEVEGLVEVRIGSGIYVRAVPNGQARDATDALAGPFELLRARRVIESECAALAAKAARRAQLRAIDTALDEMAHWAEFDYVISNQDFATAVDDLAAIVRAARLTSARQGARHSSLIAGLTETRTRE